MAGPCSAKPFCAAICEGRGRGSSAVHLWRRRSWSAPARPRTRTAARDKVDACPRPHPCPARHTNISHRSLFPGPSRDAVISVGGIPRRDNRPRACPGAAGIRGGAPQLSAVIPPCDLTDWARGATGVAVRHRWPTAACVGGPLRPAAHPPHDLESGTGRAPRRWKRARPVLSWPRGPSPRTGDGISPRRSACFMIRCDLGMSTGHDLQQTHRSGQAGASMSA